MASWTRRQLIVAALEELGIGTDSDVQPQDLDTGRVRLDAMMAEWDGRGIRVGYPVERRPEAGDLDDDSGIPSWAAEAVFLNLSLKLAPSYGRAIMRETKVSAKQALDTVAARMVTSESLRMQMPEGTPRGAGQVVWRGFTPFAPPPSFPITSLGAPILPGYLPEE